VSRLSLSTLQGIPALGNVISLTSGVGFYGAGSIIQVVQTRTSARNTYAAAVTGNGSTITDLNLTVTPKSASSLMLITWMINAEVQYDTMFTVHQDGALITTAGYEAYNREVGNARWSGVSHGQYENDTSSTMSNWRIQYAVLAGSTASRTYAPAIRSSNATAQTFYLNRTVSSTGGANAENTVSTGIIMEIAQ
jgi:hypothetical protein